MTLLAMTSSVLLLLNSDYDAAVLPIEETVDTLNNSFLLKLIVCFMFC